MFRPWHLLVGQMKASGQPEDAIAMSEFVPHSPHSVQF